MDERRPTPKVTLASHSSRLPTHSTLERDPVLDNELCNTSPCRLLLPAFLGEQESKARRHLLLLSHLAQALNRILVLPKVGKSGISQLFYMGLLEFTMRRPTSIERPAQPKAQAIEIILKFSDSDRDNITIDSLSIPELEHAEVIITHQGWPILNHCLQGRAPFNPALILRPLAMKIRWVRTWSDHGVALSAHS